MLHFWFIVILPIIFGSFMLSCSGLLKRYLLKEKKISSLQFLVIGYGLMAFICFIFYAAIYGFKMPPSLLPGFWRALFISVSANFVIQFLSAKAASLKEGEVSLTAPLQAMTPLLITFLALTLGEFPGKIGCFGVFLMICGSYVLLWEKIPNHWYDYFGPFRRLRLLLKLGSITTDERNKTIVVCLALGSAAMGTIGLLFDGLYIRRSGGMQGTALAFIVLVGSLSVGYFLWYLLRCDATIEQRANFFSLISKKKFFFLLFLFATAWVLHWLTIQPAFNKTFVAYVGTLKRFHCVFSVVLGYLLFKEKDFKKRFWAVILIILGVIFISMDGLPARLSSGIEKLGF